MDRRLRRIARPGLPHLISAVVLGTAGGLATVVQWAAFASVIDRAFLGDQGLDRLTTPLIVFVAAVALRAALAWGRELVAQVGASRISATLRARLFAHLLRLGPAWALGERTGATVAAATGGIDRLEPYYARFLPQVALSQVVPLLIAACI